MSKIRRQSAPSLILKVRARLRKMVKKARYASRVHEYRLKGKHPLRLLGTPKDPWPGSVAAGSHILSNRFYSQGGILKNPDCENGEWQAEEIWLAKGINPEWQQYLHSFCWLRDLNRAVDRKAAKHKATKLIQNWLQQFDTWHEMAWAPHILGQRIINWMAYAPLILDSNDLVYRSKLLNCLARQARHLHYAVHDPIYGLPRIQAIGGLILAGLYLPYGESWLKKGTRLLKSTLDQVILSDGGFCSRSPEDLLRALQNLLVIRVSYKAMGHNIPDKLDEAISRMIPMLKGLLHGDGKLSLFNGAGELNAEEITATFEFADEIENSIVQFDAEKSGFRGLQQGQLVVILDAGPPAERDNSHNSHGGTLSFEMSDGKQRVIVNCGSANVFTQSNDGDIFKLARSTAAHSTLILNNKNSSEICKDGRIGDGPTYVSSKRFTEKGHNLIEATHDGYVSSFGILHHRSLYINYVGDDLRGEDVLEKVKHNAANGAFDVRFHLHPDITIIQQEATDRFLLRLPSAEYWQFQCSGGRLNLEESLYLGDGLRTQKSRQIVVSGTTENKKTVIKWSLRRIEHNN